MNNYTIIWKSIFVFAFLLLIGCEEEFNPPITAEAEQYVVEGYVEAGEGANPTYVSRHPLRLPRSRVHDPYETSMMQPRRRRPRPHAQDGFL